MINNYGGNFANFFCFSFSPIRYPFIFSLITEKHFLADIKTTCAKVNCKLCGFILSKTFFVCQNWHRKWFSLLEIHEYLSSRKTYWCFRNISNEFHENFSKYDETFRTNEFLFRICFTKPWKMCQAHCFKTRNIGGHF